MVQIISSAVDNYGPRVDMSHATSKSHYPKKIAEKNLHRQI